MVLSIQGICSSHLHWFLDQYSIDLCIMVVHFLLILKITTTISVFEAFCVLLLLFLDHDEFEYWDGVADLRHKTLKQLYVVFLLEPDLDI